MQQPLTQQQIESDLARLPPAAAGPVTTAAAASTPRGVSELALVLLHQQCRELLAEEQKDAAMEARIAQLRAELQSTQTKGGSGETDDDDSSAGARMADALEDEAEEPDKEAYLRVLKAQGMLPMTIRLPKMEDASGSDGTEHQLIRDLERDQLELDGCGYKPGLGGYARVVQWLRGAMEARLQECLPAPGECVWAMLLKDRFGGGEGSGGAQAPLEAFAKELLRRINRTHSAGVSYERLTQALGVEGLTRIVPDSAAAAPLSIELDVGAFPLPAPATSKSSTKPSSSSTPRKSPQRTNSKGDRKQQQQKQQAGGGGSGRDDDGDWAWGLRARLVTATSYTVFDDAVEEPWLGVRVAYRETVCLPLVHPWIGSGAVSLGACVRMDHR